MTNTSRHVTRTELALFYDNGLNESDAAIVREHLAACKDCAEQYMWLCDSLKEMRSGKIRRAWKMKVRRYLSRVIGNERAARKTGVILGKVIYQAETRDYLEDSSATMYATAAPGSTGPEKSKAAVCAEDGEIWDVEADCRISIEKNGEVNIAVYVLERIAELSGKSVSVGFSNEYDSFEVGPARLLPVEGYEDILEAHLKREADPEKGLSREQLEDMTAKVVISN